MFGWKQRRVSFKSHSLSKKYNLLELILSNVCGPLKEKTHGGVLYFVIIIGDCSRKKYVYVMKTND